MNISVKIRTLLCVFVFFFVQVDSVQAAPDTMFVSTEGWKQVERVSLSSDGKALRAEGEGDILLGIGESVLLETGRQYIDARIKLEFMVSEGASAHFYALGRYGIALADSANKHELNPNDMGGLEPQVHKDKNEVEVQARGIMPLVNAARKAGEWQSLEMSIRAPRYNESGAKTDIAFFPEVKINGQLVQRNTLATNFTLGSIKPWEVPKASMTFRVNSGHVALRKIEISPTDYAALTVPKAHGNETNVKNLVDAVEEGKKYFQGFGCQECHSTTKGDTAVKSGPNLFGLFQQPARDREIVEGGEQHRFTLKADSNYLYRSIREPASQLAVYEGQIKTGQAYSPVMPPYSKEILTDFQLESIGAYLASLNSPQTQGPIIKLVTVTEPKNYNPVEDKLQFLVSNRTRIQRGPMAGLSSRSIHVGLVNGVNFSFDPRQLAIVKIWQGGFLNMLDELQNRGGGGLQEGFNTQKISFGDQDYLISPLNTKGKFIDFSFKEARFGDAEAKRILLDSDEGLEELITRENANFLGYTLNSTRPESVPAFKYRVGKNVMEQLTEISADGKLLSIISGDFQQEQRFKLNLAVLNGVQVKGAEIKANELIVAPGKARRVELKAHLALSSTPWKAEKTSFVHAAQKVQSTEATADLPEGYQIESIFPPKNNFGQEQLFEALGMAQAKDGTIVVSTRTAGIWRIVEGEWRPFAEGTFDSLGLVIEDDKGLVLTVGQKAELTRISDDDGDGRADTFRTLFDAFAYHGNYHTYMHGPVKTADGKYFVTLNLAHDDAAFKAGGQYMGTYGGYSGWGFLVDENGGYEPWVNGLRSPAGLGVGPDGALYYTENQGEYVGTSKLFAIEKGGYYGHPAGLVDLPGQNPEGLDVISKKMKDQRKRAILLFPHLRVANSPGHLEWNQTEGKFGLFEGQIFMGDQTLSRLYRLSLEPGSAGLQGAVMPFAANLESGVMRPVFLADGSLLIGQTGRGWQSNGGKVASIQRVSWDGKTRPEEIDSVKILPNGFEMVFTAPLKKVRKKDLKVSSWRYRDAPAYGSLELGLRKEKIRSVKLSRDKKSLVVTLRKRKEKQLHPDQTSRVYHLEVNRKSAFGTNAERSLEAWYTVNSWP